MRRSASLEVRADALRGGFFSRAEPSPRPEEHRGSPAGQTAPSPGGPNAVLPLGTIEAHGTQSTRETTASVYTQRLQQGVNGVQGIMSVLDMEGKPLLPFDHQRNCVKKFVRVKWGLIAHDAGLGKTAAAFQLYCALHLAHGGNTTMVIVAPSATLSQWESTAHDWLNLPNKKEVIFKTTKSAQITATTLARIRVLITTRHCISNCYKSCYHLNKQHHQNSRSAWVSGWERKPGSDLHPIFSPLNSQPRFTVMISDEIHLMRNADTEWAVSHNQLAKNSVTRYGMSATPVYNDPSDMVGICKSLNADEVYQNPNHWSMNKVSNTLNPTTANQFRLNVDRVNDSILNLPPIIQSTVSFEPLLSQEDSKLYNNILKEARALKIEVEKEGKASRDDLRRLMELLGKLQQCLVSPLLSQKGAEYFKQNTECFERAAQQRTGSLQALQTEIETLQTEGHARVMVACCHVAPMQIAKAYLKLVGADVGEIFSYYGELNLEQRQVQKIGFLTAKRSVLFLSIDAGGTGLHLVPGCNAAIFWGKRPWSPAQVWQTMKRIHRIGQDNPVFIRHLIAEGSVDSAVDHVHADKKALADAIVDNDWSGMSGDGCSWRKARRIVDACRFVDEEGRFVAAPPPQGGKAGKKRKLPGPGGIIKRPSSPCAAPPVKRPAYGLNSADAAAAAKPLGGSGKKKVVVERWKPISTTNSSAAFFGTRDASVGSAGSSVDTFRPARISFAPPSPSIKRARESE